VSPSDLLSLLPVLHACPSQEQPRDEVPDALCNPRLASAGTGTGRPNIPRLCDATQDRHGGFLQLLANWWPDWLTQSKETRWGDTWLTAAWDRRSTSSDITRKHAAGEMASGERKVSPPSQARCRVSCCVGCGWRVFSRRVGFSPCGSHGHGGDGDSRFGDSGHTTDAGEETRRWWTASVTVATPIL